MNPMYIRRDTVRDNCSLVPEDDFAFVDDLAVKIMDRSVLMFWECFRDILGMFMVVMVVASGGVMGRLWGATPPTQPCCLSPGFNNRWQRMLPLGEVWGALAPQHKFRCPKKGYKRSSVEVHWACTCTKRGWLGAVSCFQSASHTHNPDL